MRKAIYMSIHIPCVLLVALQKWLWVHKDNINWFMNKLVRDTQELVIKVFKFVFYLAVTTPVAMIFMILFIKLS